MRAMKGINIPESIVAEELSLVSGLAMYYRKMSTYTNNDKLLIYCFHDSLTGVAVQ